VGDYFGSGAFSLQSSSVAGGLRVALLGGRECRMEDLELIMGEKRPNRKKLASVDPDFRAGFYGGERMTETLDPRALFGRPSNLTRRDQPTRLRPAAKASVGGHDEGDDD
jgi:hypothetical protein